MKDRPQIKLDTCPSFIDYSFMLFSFHISTLFSKLAKQKFAMELISCNTTPTVLMGGETFCFGCLNLRGGVLPVGTKSSYISVLGMLKYSIGLRPQIAEFKIADDLMSSWATNWTKSQLCFFGCCQLVITKIERGGWQRARCKEREPRLSSQ